MNLPEIALRLAHCAGANKPSKWLRSSHTFPSGSWKVPIVPQSCTATDRNTVRLAAHVSVATSATLKRSVIQALAAIPLPRHTTPPGLIIR